MKKLLLFNVPFPPAYFKYSCFCFGVTIQFFLFSKALYLPSFLYWEDGWRTERHTKPRGTQRNPRGSLAAFFLEARPCQLPSGIPGDSARAVIRFSGFPACNRLIYSLQEVVEDYCPVTSQNNLPEQIYLECHLNCHQLCPPQCFVLQGHENLSLLSPQSKSECHLCSMKVLAFGAGPAMALGTAVLCGHTQLCSALLSPAVCKGRGSIDVV